MIDPCKCSHSRAKHLDDGVCRANLVCSCTQFEGSISERKKVEPSWTNMFSLEDLIRKMLKEGQEEEVVNMIQKMPEPVMSKYRLIYSEHKRSKL